MNSKKTPLVLVVLSIIFLLLGCHEPIQDCAATEGKNVLLINRTANKKTVSKTILIDDKVFLKEMCTILFNERKRLTDVNVRDNRGFFEVVFDADRSYYFMMIYTDYDGTVFRLSTNLYYQNDSLVKLLESRFILPER